MYNIPRDSAMLLSYVNLKLRDQYKNLDEFCDDLDVSVGELKAKLAAIGYEYDNDTNQFT